MSSDLRTAIIENITIADFLRSEGYYKQARRKN